MFEKRLPLLIFRRTSTKTGLYSLLLYNFIVKVDVTVKYLRTSSKTSRIFEVPNEHEVDTLKKKYCNPKKIVLDLLKPFVASGQIIEPQIEYIPRLNGSYWKARLHVRWPHPMNFTGTHTCISQAEENAYLLACQLYHSVGVIRWDVDQQCLTPMTKSHVLSMLDTIVDKQRVASAQPQTYKFSSSRYKTDQGTGGWKSDLTVPWPSIFSVSAVAPTLHGSHYAVCLLACIKLKMLRLLESDNSLASDRVRRLAKYIASHNHYQPIVEDFNPDHQIFVDASRLGFGSYLLTNTDERVRWISESWPEHFKVKQGGISENTFDSCFYEFYALIASCYTWKHKFVNKKVLCWSDNQHAVKLVNLAAADVYDVETIKRFKKLYEILMEMSRKYNIHLRAHYVNRVHNQAADHLSRSQVEQFRKIVPAADEKAKKTKKLLFRNPLIPKDYDPRNKTVS